ncbi:MAG: hypothetical protein JWP94_421 [Mucilaginibacter sp.]|jgi:hypothetical protein|nr:hypothetical protein [Mucilaginibacter sp.]
MKKLLRIILPPLAGFVIFAALIKFGPLARHIGGLPDIGNETLYGLMDYFKIFTPLLFLTALLTQLLIIIPLWRKILSRSHRLMNILIFVCIVTTLLSAGISYLIWDSATGTGHLLSIFLFMAGVQAFYWLINFGVLYLIDKKEFNTPAADQSNI